MTRFFQLVLCASALAAKAADIAYYAGGVHPGTTLKAKVTGADAAPVHQSVRTRPCKFIIPLDNGVYELKLYFLRSAKPNGVARIEVEGKIVEQELAISDPRKDKAETYQAVVQSYRCKVEDERLDILFPPEHCRKHAIAGIEVLDAGGHAVIRSDCGARRPAEGWSNDKLFPPPVQASIQLDPIDVKGKWVNISDEIMAKLLKLDIAPIARWHINETPGMGFMCIFADRAGNTYANIMGQGLWKYEQPGGTFSRADGGRYTSLVGNRSANNSNSGGYIQVYINPNGQGFYLVSWCCFSSPTDQIYSPDGETLLNYRMGSRDTWDYGTVCWQQSPPRLMMNVRHHSAGEAALSQDGGKTWEVLFNYGKRVQALGIIGPNILIRAGHELSHPVKGRIPKDDDDEIVGIHRSTDLGKTWEKVSDVQITKWLGPMVVYKGRAYLNADDGLLVSDDNGASWQLLPGSPAFTQPIVFGKTDTQLMGVNHDGYHESLDGGASWALVVKAPANVDTCFWDPVRDVFYAGQYNGRWFRYER